MIMNVDPETIDPEVVGRTEFIVNGKFLTKEEVTELFEEVHETELDHRIGNMDKREMITVCCAAIRKYPLEYLQVVAQYILELIKDSRKGRRNNAKNDGSL